MRERYVSVRLHRADVVACHLLDLLERPASVSPLAVDGDEEVPPEQEVHLPDRQLPVRVGVAIEQDQDVARVVLDLGDLVLVQAVLHRERMDLQGPGQGVQVSPGRVQEVKPDITPSLVAGQRLLQAVHAPESLARLDVEVPALRHGEPPGAEPSRAVYLLRPSSFFRNMNFQSVVYPLDLFVEGNEKDFRDRIPAPREGAGIWRRPRAGGGSDDPWSWCARTPVLEAERFASALGGDHFFAGVFGLADWLMIVPSA
jgi:hypothetical protein